MRVTSVRWFQESFYPIFCCRPSWQDLLWPVFLQRKKITNKKKITKLAKEVFVHISRFAVSNKRPWTVSDQGRWFFAYNLIEIRGILRTKMHQLAESFFQFDKKVRFWLIWRKETNCNDFCQYSFSVLFFYFYWNLFRNKSVTIFLLFWNVRFCQQTF